MQKLTKFQKIASQIKPPRFFYKNEEWFAGGYKFMEYELSKRNLEDAEINRYDLKFCIGERSIVWGYTDNIDVEVNMDSYYCMPHDEHKTE
jgi:hypothetical protein